MKLFILSYWKWLAMMFMAVVVACSDDFSYDPAPADRTILSLRPDVEHLYW